MACVSRRGVRRVRFSDAIPVSNAPNITVRNPLAVNADANQATSSTGSVNVLKTPDAISCNIYELYTRKRIGDNKAAKRKKAVLDYVMKHNPIVGSSEIRSRVKKKRTKVSVTPSKASLIPSKVLIEQTEGAGQGGRILVKPYKCTIKPIRVKGKPLEFIIKPAKGAAKPVQPLDTIVAVKPTRIASKSTRVAAKSTRFAINQGASCSHMPTPIITEHKEPDVVGLINETRQMAISPLAIEPANEPTALQDHHYASPSGSGSGKKNLEKTDEENQMVPLYSKRALKLMLSERQTAKLNKRLKKKNLGFASADKLKAAVFEAWNEVKHDKTYLSRIFAAHKRKFTKPQKRKKPDSSSDDLEKSSKKKKCKLCKCKIIPEQAPQQSLAIKSKEDLEENKMAFQAWKKKKDEILRQRMAEKCRMEEKEKLDSLMNERIRKNDGESAFLAWSAHKSVTLKTERKEKKWLLQKEKEKLHLKMEKNDEAAKVYFEWLKNKMYSTNNNTLKVNEEKPPWTPPGKTNSLI